jgi:hypothetical protein
MAGRSLRRAGLDHRGFADSSPGHPDSRQRSEAAPNDPVSFSLSECFAGLPLGYSDFKPNAPSDRSQECYPVGDHDIGCGPKEKRHREIGE